ncbi:MAG: ribose-phosphate pyrophosphokinase, partial [Chitinivibrionales bacterium]
AIERIKNSPIRKLVVTDTVYISEEKRIPKLEVVSVAELFAKAITYTNQGESISGLYKLY